MGASWAGEIAKTIIPHGSDEDPEETVATATGRQLELIAITAELLSEIYKLTDTRERMVLTAYYCNNRKLKEIAEILDISMAQLARIKKAAIQHLGEVLDRD